MTRRRALVVAASVVCLALVVGVAVKVRRDREWAHGGDNLNATAEVRLADGDTLSDTATVLGVPFGEPLQLPEDFRQAIVARVRWTGLARDRGLYQIIVLDKRVTPPRPMPVYGGWDASGGTGAAWSSSYDVLGDHYGWLEGTGMVRGITGSWTSVGQAVGIPASAEGTVTVVLLVGTDDVPLTDAATETIVTLFYVEDSGEVRWAKRVAG
jgi:hypothetical protein